MQGEKKTGFWRSESAATAALYALALPALVAVAGIGFDYSRIASMDTELQNAADQAALAGATQLDQSVGSMSRAAAAASGGLVSNSTLFANDGAGTTATVPNTSVFFYELRTDAENGTNPLNRALAANDAKAKFIRVAVATRTAEYALTPVVGAFSGDIDAEAVAGIGAALCRTPPLMICNPSEPLGNANKEFPFTALKGVGVLLKGGGSGGGAWAPGNFGFLDTIPGGGAGTPDLRRALGWESSDDNCVSKTANDTVDTSTGNKVDVSDSMNTRFDIYNGDVSCPSGGNCPASINSVKDVMHPADFTSSKACWDTNSGMGAKDGWQETSGTKYLPPSNAPLDLTVAANIPVSMGHPRDICHSNDPKSCTGPFGDGVWDINAYFASHYVKSDGTTRWAQADYTAAPSVVGLSALTTSSTRYEVYLWEIAMAGETFRNTEILAPRTVAGLTSYGKPVCSSKKLFGTGTVPSTTVADRRRLSVAVINCIANGVKGNSKKVPVKEFIDVFLVQPSLTRTRTAKDEIYIEIIGKTASGSLGETAGTVIRRDVPYLIR